MDTQPPHRGDRATWVDAKHNYWRIERIAGRWQLSLYSPPTEMWVRVGGYPSKTAAIEAATEQNRP
jgi:hypothetical protein